MGGSSARRSRTRSGRATTPPWPTCRSRPATPGSGTTAAPPAGGSTRTTGSSRRSSSTTPATTTRSCTSTTPILNRVAGPGREVAHPRLARRCYRWRAGRGRGRRADHRGAPDPRARGAGSRPARTARPARSSASRQEAMDLFSSRRRAITAKAAELVAAFEARYGRAPNGAGARPAARGRPPWPPGGRSRTTGETREQLLDRVDAQLRAEVAGGLAGVAARRRSPPASTDPAPQAWSPQAVIETALADVQAAQGRLDPRRPHPRDQRRAARLPRHPRRRRRRPAARRADRRGARRCAVPLDAARPGDDAAARRAAAGQRRVGLPGPGRAALRHPGPRPHRTRLLAAAARRRRRAALPHAGRAAVPRRAARVRASSSAPTRPPPCAASSPPARGSRPWSARPAPASRFVVGALARGLDRPRRCAAPSAAAGVRAGHLPDRHRGPRRRRA